MQHCPEFGGSQADGVLEIMEILIPNRGVPAPPEFENLDSPGPPHDESHFSSPITPVAELVFSIDRNDSVIGYSKHTPVLLNNLPTDRTRRHRVSTVDSSNSDGLISCVVERQTEALATSVLAHFLLIFKFRTLNSRLMIPDPNAMWSIRATIPEILGNSRETSLIDSN